MSSSAAATAPSANLRRLQPCVVVASRDADVRTLLVNALQRDPSFDVHVARDPSALVDLVHGLRLRREGHRICVLVDDRPREFRRALHRVMSICPDVAVESGASVASAIDRARTAPSPSGIASIRAAVTSLVGEVRSSFDERN